MPGGGVGVGGCAQAARHDGGRALGDAGRLEGAAGAGAREERPGLVGCRRPRDAAPALPPPWPLSRRRHDACSPEPPPKISICAWGWQRCDRPPPAFRRRRVPRVTTVAGPHTAPRPPAPAPSRPVTRPRPAETSPRSAQQGPAVPTTSPRSSKTPHAHVSDRAACTTEAIWASKSPRAPRPPPPPHAPRPARPTSSTRRSSTPASAMSPLASPTTKRPTCFSTPWAISSSTGLCRLVCF